MSEIIKVQASLVSIFKASLKGFGNTCKLKPSGLCAAMPVQGLTVTENVFDNVQPLLVADTEYTVFVTGESAIVLAVVLLNQL